MTRREKAIRAAVESLNMSREAKGAIVDVWREVDESYAEAVRDLKARLKACAVVMRGQHDITDDMPAKRAFAALDLRRKNWRKP